MKKLTKLSLLLFTIHLSLIVIFAQTGQKAELIFQGNINSFGNEFNDPFEFSPDGKKIATVWKNKIVLWDVETGRVLRIFGSKESEFGYFTSIAISSDGNVLAGGFFDSKQITGRMKFWNVSDGKEIFQDADLAFLAMILEIEFSPDQKLLISTTIGVVEYDMPSKNTIALINWENGPGATTGWDYSVTASYSPNGKHIYWRNSYQGQASGGFLIGRRPAVLTDTFIIGRRLSINNKGEFVFINDKKKIASMEKFVYDEKLDEGGYQTIHTIDKDFQSVFFNPQNDDELIISNPGKLIKRNLKSNNDQTLLLEKNLNSVTEISKNGKFVTNGTQIWNIDTGKLIQDFNFVLSKTSKFDYSDKSVYADSNNKIYIGKNGESAIVWDLNGSNKPSIGKFSAPKDQISFGNEPIKFNGIKFVFSGSFIKIESEKAGSNDAVFLYPNLLLKHFDSENNILTVVSSESFEVGVDIFKIKKFAYEKDYYEFERIGGEVIRLNVGYRGHVPPPILLEQLEFDKNTLLAEVRKLKDKAPKFVNDLHTYFNNPFTKNHKYRISSENNRLRIFDNESGIEICSLFASGENEWAVITPDGLFDASPDARKLMHYVIELEPISLEQMKDIYYVPGLLQKILKGEPLPKVELFSKKDLFPEVEFSAPKTGQENLTVKLTNRGGGIGQVQILVNGKEFVSDARPAGFDVEKKDATLTVSLKDAPLVAGQENKIEVVARNAAGSLSTRGSPRGTEIINLAGSVKKETPNIYVIAGGISNYTGDNLKLNFAAKDAEDFARAVELGAVKLLGDKSKVHIRLLTSGGAQSGAKFDVPDARLSTATKADFEKAFADFRNATPNDVFIVYLAGHGVSLNLNQNPNQPGGDTYLYLTQEATTTDRSVLSIENSRRVMTISSDELKDLMKQNKALKQVLILDTCASGQAAASFVQKRDLPSDQIRAIERLKDNTGFYVLMGSAADAVSYEASQYGQGLLTYSLLQGMKGARLRENQFADVNLLFTFAQETVPQMAKNIGGIQQPRIITPDTSASFDIGKFTTDEQKLINLSSPKPIILRPILQNKEQDYDDLELTRELQAKLREANYVLTRGGEKNSELVFVDADEMVDAIKPSGSYVVKNNEIVVTIRLIRNKIPVETLIVSGKTNEKDVLIDDIVSRISQASRR